MPKEKSGEKEFIYNFDRLPAKEAFSIRTKEILSALASFYGFEPIQTSLLEEPRFFSSLIRGGFWEESLPVQSKTSSGIDFLLRPSWAIGILRAYISHRMNDFPHPLKFLFSGERFAAAPAKSSSPQIRIFNEWGLCMIGEEGPIAEAEVIQVLWKGVEKLGIPQANLQIRLSATGCNECRSQFRSPFVAHFRPRVYRLCRSCKKALKKSPTKILQCKEEQCRMLAQNAPQVLDYLCEICKKHLRGVLEFLDEAKISYLLDPKFFKEGSLYSSLIFELAVALDVKPVEGAETKEETPKQKLTLAEGGRVTRAAELAAGKKIDMVMGVASIAGIEEALKRGTVVESDGPKVFLTQLGELAKRKSLGLIEALREGGISVQETLGRDSVKSQLKVAERVGAEIALILGQKEALDDTIIVRELRSGIQETIPQEKLIEFLKKRLKR